MKDENLSPDRIWSIGWINGSIGRTLFCRMADNKYKQQTIGYIHTSCIIFSSYFIILLNCSVSLPSVFGLSPVLIKLSPEKEMK